MDSENTVFVIKSGDKPGAFHDVHGNQGFCAENPKYW